jgi:hypothetical protein
MALNHVKDSKHWRDRAAEMRPLANTMKEPETIEPAGRCTTSWRFEQRRALGGV